MFIVAFPCQDPSSGRFFCSPTCGYLNILAELASILSDPSKSALAALFLAMPPSPQCDLVQLLDEVPALVDLLDLFLFPT